MIDRYGNRLDMRERVHAVSARVGRTIAEEVSPHVVELNFDPGPAQDFWRDYVVLQRDFFRACQGEGIEPLPFGLVPFANEEAARRRLRESVTSHPSMHYRWLVERDGLDTLASLEGMCGLQVHVERQNGENAVVTARTLAYCVPLFAGLAASSPIRDGRYAANASERIGIKLGMPLSGIPQAPALRDLASVRAHLDASARTLRSVSPGYYFVRLPRVELATIENCTMDMVPDLSIASILMHLHVLISDRVAEAMLLGEPLPSHIFGSGMLEGGDRACIMRQIDGVLRSPRLFDAMIETHGGDRILFREYLREVVLWARGDAVFLSSIDSMLYAGTVSERIVRTLGL
ncbi:MAG TPA: hypothetical protein PK765_00555 [bacterium]|nr:hypothetical protein [bacterium]